MNYNFRNGKFDVVIAAGPRLKTWPSTGVRALSVLCAETGLSVGQFGGESVTVRGAVPLPGTGGIVLIEDIQKRIHRVHARAIVRVVPEALLPDPFPGWRSPGLIPLDTAERLFYESQVQWDNPTVLLGTGNRALRFGSTLLAAGCTEVYCVENYPQWSAKRYAGWEVEKRNFEMLGGKLIEASPVHLAQKRPLLWELRVQDSQGVRVMDVGRVISAGPFRNFSGVRSHPPGSFLYELEQTAGNAQAENVEGWALEEERGKWLAGKIIKALTHDLGSKREDLDRTFRRAKGRLKRYFTHREAPFAPSYQGKWMAAADSKWIRSFSGVPRDHQRLRPTASVECFEEIPCNICQQVCPTSAISIGRVPRNDVPILNEAACISCGLCVEACPTRSIAMIYEKENHSTATITLPWAGSRRWKTGESTVLVNRRGESLGSGRISNIIETEKDKPQLLQIEVPVHLTWDARSVRRGRTPESSDENYLASVARSSTAPEKVEIILNGEKRLVRDRIPVSIALFEIGQNRPEDTLLCRDGSCGMCAISVDSVNKLACQTKIHKGMTIRISDGKSNDLKVPDKKPNDESEYLCPCKKVTQEQIVERLKQGKLQSPEAVASVTQVGEGKCHGQLCMGALRRVLSDQGLDADHWIDWRFPWADWLLSHN